MKIALFHNQPVPPKHYGGTERVCAWLCQGLVEHGHEVTLLAPGVSNRPDPSFSKGWGRTLGALEVRTWDPRLNSEQQLRQLLPSKVDLLHSMVALPGAVEAALGLPILTTIHGNGRPGEKFSKTSVFVSRDHASRHGSQTFVWNGLDPEEFPFDPKAQREGLAFLAKTSWRVKNLRGAARICAKAGVPLSIAGGERPLAVRVEAALRRGWRWRGAVSGAEKARHLAGARALVFPVLWPEPFGLVVAEALFCGTPVLGTPLGSLSELIPESVGRLLEWSDQEQWVQLVAETGSGRLAWDPSVCRAHAMEHFHYRQMTQSYVKLYERLRSGRI
jgi:glycosyltransferase involved in cell wall biosynthesis